MECDAFPFSALSLLIGEVLLLAYQGRPGKGCAVKWPLQECWHSC